MFSISMSFSDVEVLYPSFTDDAYNLPIITIDTLGNRLNTKNLQRAKMSIYDNGSKLNYLNETPSLTIDIGIKIRGKSSKTYPKKQYKIELWDENGSQITREILNLPRESDWVLHGPFEDKSLIRNKLAFEIASKMMVYVPQSKYCEIFVIDDGSKTIEDKHFRGLYLLNESIKKSEERVSVFPSYNDLAETSFLAAKDVPALNDITVTTYGNDTIIYPRKIKLNYPKKNVSNEQLKYISRTISEFERVLYSDKYNDDSGGYEDYIIIESFVDYYIINEFFRNTDAGVYSTYFSKDYGEKIRLGPIWDFNESMGNDLDGGDYFDSKGFYMSNNFWFKRLMTDREFVVKVIDRYRLLRRTFLSDEYLLEQMDALNFELKNAANRNFRKWPFELCAQAEIFEQTWLGLLGSKERIAEHDDLSEEILSELEKYDAYSSDPVVLLEILEKYSHMNVKTSIGASDYLDETLKLKEFVVNRGEWMDANIDFLLKFTY